MRPGLSSRCLNAWHAARRALPSDCPLCAARSQGGALCPPCAADVAWPVRDARQPRCQVCALPLRLAHEPCPDCAHGPRRMDVTINAIDYAPPADLLVMQYKLGRRYRQAELLADLLAVAIAHHGGLPADIRLVPIPGSARSLRARGFNPAAELARALGRRLDLRVDVDLLARRREGDTQHHLDRAGRARNADDLFVATRTLNHGPVAIVDDVMTTGATADAAAVALRAAGAGMIPVLVAARTPFPAWHARD